MKTPVYSIALVVTAFLALSMPAFAGHEFYRDRENCACAKRIDVLTDRLLTHYRKDLKACGCWKPRGRAKVLYNAVFELEKRADHLRSAFDNRCSDDFIACRIEAVAEATCKISKMLRRIEVSECFHELLEGTDEELMHMAAAFGADAHSH